MVSNYNNAKIIPKYTNSKKDLVITQIKKGNDIGNIRLFPVSAKSWFNSIYFFDKNTIRNLSYLDIIVNKIIKIYFNLISNIDDNIKFMPRRNRARNRSINRIFVSRADIKHFNDKVIITIYTFNRIKKYYLKNLLNVLKDNSNNTSYVLYNTFKSIKKKYSVFRNHIKKDLPFIFPKLNFLNNLKKFKKQYYKTIITNIL